jgi:hypothetical protein
MEKDPKLVLFTNTFDGREIDEPRLKKDLIKYMNKFIGMLEIPTYERMTMYNFHDTIVAMVKYVFTVNHVHAF